MFKENKVSVSPVFVRSSKRKINNVYSMLEFPYNLLNIFALRSVRREETGELGPHRCLFRIIATAVILGVLGFGGWYLRALYSYEGLMRTIKVTDAFQTVSDFVEYLVHAFCAYSRGQLFMMEYYKHYENIDRLLGVKNYVTFARYIINYLLFFVIFWIAVCAVDLAGWAGVVALFDAILWATAYIFILLRALVITELTFHVMILGCRLRHIGNVLEINYHSFASLACEAMDPLASEHNLSNKLGSVPKSIAKNNGYWVAMSADKHGERVKLLSQCYMVLMSQSDYLNNAYGLRILLCFVNALTDILRWVNVGYIILFSSSFHAARAHGLPLLSCVLRTLLGTALLLGLARYCEQCYRQRERILRILTHTLLNKSISAHYRSALEEMREVVSGQPLELTAYHVFRIDYPLLQSMVSAIVTYTIILTQLEE